MEGWSRTSRRFRHEHEKSFAIGRDIAGVHWRSDSRESIALGEAIAIQLLREHRALYNENFGGFSLTKYDGTTVTV